MLWGRGESENVGCFCNFIINGWSAYANILVTQAAMLRFFLSIWETRCTDGVEMWRGRFDLRWTPPRNISPPSLQGWCVAPQKLKNLPIFETQTTRRGVSLARFLRNC